MRRRSSKLILATSLTVAVAAIVGGVASAQVATSTQTEPPAPSDSAAFPGGGTVSVLGVDYPKGTAVPAVGSPESGPAAEEAQKATVDSSSSDDGVVVTSAQVEQAGQSGASDSAAFPGGGTVSVLGVVYPKGTAVPAVGSPESGPAVEKTHKATVDSSPSDGRVTTLSYRRAVSAGGPTTAQTSSSDGGTVNSPDGKQPTASPSDSAAFSGGGTVSVLGVNYPKGTSVPAVGTYESGPTLLPTEGYYAAPSSSGGGFDWPDAGIGLAIGLGAVGVIALVVVGIRKHTATPITV
jgi:hypothetical protein